MNTFGIFIEPQEVYEQRVKKQAEDRDREWFFKFVSRLDYLEQNIMERWANFSEIHGGGLNSQKPALY